MLFNDIIWAADLSLFSKRYADGNATVGFARSLIDQGVSLGLGWYDKYESDATVYFALYENI